MSEQKPNNISNDNSELFHELTPKEVTFTGSNIYNESNEIDNKGK